MSNLERQAAKMICVGFDGHVVPAETRALIARGAGAAVLFKRNFATAEQFAGLCADLKGAAGGRPFANCIDHEGGRVVRLGEPFTRIPSMRDLGLRDDPALARAIGALMGRELRAANVDWNFAPVMDVDTNPANPVIASRSFGRTPELVSRLGVAMIDGMQSAGVAACAKHFPGHGDTSQDSHTDLPRLPHAMGRLDEVELPPFRAAIGAGVASIMTAHVIFEPIDATLPATMSRPVLTGVLREAMRFEGVVVSDDLEMKAIAGRFNFDEVILRGALAGIDLFTIAHSAALQDRAIEVLVKAVERGELPREQIESSNRRLGRLFARYVQAANVGPPPDVIGSAAHRAVVAEIEKTTKEHDPTVFAR